MSRGFDTRRVYTDDEAKAAFKALGEELASMSNAKFIPYTETQHSRYGYRASDGGGIIEFQVGDTSDTVTVYIAKRGFGSGWSYSRKYLHFVKLDTSIIHIDGREQPRWTLDTPKLVDKIQARVDKLLTDLRERQELAKKQEREEKSLQGSILGALRGESFKVLRKDYRRIIAYIGENQWNHEIEFTYTNDKLFDITKTPGLTADQFRRVLAILKEATDGKKTSESTENP